MSAAAAREVHVLAGVIFDAAGRVLLAQRPDGKDLAGYWEFPGGKLEPGETRFEALSRELREELGIHIGPARPLTRVRHAYPHKRVLLDFWIVRQYTGEPRGLEDQRLCWYSTDELRQIPLLPADQPMLRLIGLPETIVSVSGPSYRVVNAAGDRRGSRLIGVLCTDAPSAVRAVQGGADFILLTHPLPLGELTVLCLAVDVPVYVSGVSAGSAWSLGATGINLLAGQVPSASQ